MGKKNPMGIPHRAFVKTIVSIHKGLTAVGIVYLKST